MSSAVRDTERSPRTAQTSHGALHDGPTRQRVVPAVSDVGSRMSKREMDPATGEPRFPTTMRTDYKVVEHQIESRARGVPPVTSIKALSGDFSYA